MGSSLQSPCPAGRRQGVAKADYVSAPFGAKFVLDAEGVEGVHGNRLAIPVCVTQSFSADGVELPTQEQSLVHGSVAHRFQRSLATRCCE